MSTNKPTDLVSADPVEAKTHSFIVKIWLEDGLEESNSPEWCGHITHVPSGDRQYLRNLDGIIDFVTPYLKPLGIRTGFYWQLRSRFNRSNRLNQDEPWEK